MYTLVLRNNLRNETCSWRQELTIEEANGVEKMALNLARETDWNLSLTLVREGSAA